MIFIMRSTKEVLCRLAGVWRHIRISTSCFKIELKSSQTSCIRNFAFFKPFYRSAKRIVIGYNMYYSADMTMIKHGCCDEDQDVNMKVL